MAALAISDTADGRRTLSLTGRLDATTLPELWPAARRAAADAPRRPLVIDASGVEYCDGAGAALLVDLLRQPREGKVEVTNETGAWAKKTTDFRHLAGPMPGRRWLRGVMVQQWQHGTSGNTKGLRLPGSLRLRLARPAHRQMLLPRRRG